MGLKRAGKYEDFEVRRAIERKNIMFLMELRDSQFELLVQSTGGSTPLLHALRLGPSRAFKFSFRAGCFRLRIQKRTLICIHPRQGSSDRLGRSYLASSQRNN